MGDLGGYSITQPLPPTSTTMATIMILPNQTVLTPPDLPSYLRTLHELQPIVGKPTDEEVKAIHAVIRALNSIVHLYTVYDPNLSVQLSQHLFGAQMAVYQANHSMSMLPGNVYTPPTLPPHIPSTLNPVTGTPSIEDIKSAQSALRTAESLVTSPQMFNANLNMNLSQHLFDLQFARYIHDLTQGKSVSGDRSGPPFVSQPIQAPQDDFSVHPNSDSEEQIQSTPVARSEQVRELPSEIGQLGEIMKEMRDATRESKGVLDNMNRMLMSIKRDQLMVRPLGTYHVVQTDPLNQQGTLASESGLPQLRCYSYPNSGRVQVSLNDDQIARYLEFFGVGAALINEDEEIKLVDGKKDEAERLLLAQVGIS
ncbi:hypothetical protein RSOL_075420 [Rhizoctonia solani AG-3 Rhs1AP]|uniref:Laminin domain protein n=1 Tax=Rhizoctonia solani AG-3 Rhs1AP TaxID=1086054 RepID=X8J0N4_9AGAM|nr:hypothetical protein RSOL_075420 [Rhizoctonia solani AG-3 Rhs1AP]